MTEEKTPYERAMELARRARDGETAWTTRSIADEIGVNQRTIARWRREAGLSGPRGNPVTQAEAAQWRKQYDEEGLSVADIAAASGRHALVVSKHIADVLDVKRQRKPRSIATSEETIDRYVRLADQGYSAASIAKNEGDVSATTVKRRIRERRKQQEEQGE